MKLIHTMLLAVALHTLPGAAVVAEELCGRSVDDPPALLETMRADPQFRLVQRTRDYIAMTEGDGRRIWTFTTPRHEAYPAVACRTLRRQENGSWAVQTKLRCWGTQQVCDRLRDAFARLNRDMAEDIRRRQPQSGDGI